MRERITIREIVVVAAAFIFGVFFAAYMHIQKFFIQAVTQKLTLGNQCAPDAAAQLPAREVPNKMLFISCGGFLQ